MMEAVNGGTLNFNVKNGYHDGVENSGTIEAVGADSTVTLTGYLTNASGEIEANGTGSTVALTGYLINASGGTIEAVDGGAVSVTGFVGNGGSAGTSYGGMIEADGGTVSIVTTLDGGVANASAGTIEAVDGGTVSITGLGLVTNSISATIEAVGAASTTHRGRDQCGHDGGRQRRHARPRHHRRRQRQLRDDHGRRRHGQLRLHGHHRQRQRRRRKFRHMEAVDGGTLTIAGGIPNNGTIEAVGLGATVNLEAGKVTNTGTLAALDGGTLALTNATVTNTGAMITVDDASTLDLTGAALTGGTVNIAGLLNSTGASFITGAAITDTGTIEATGGTLTIDPGTLTNSGTLEANGGTLQIDGTPVTNTGTLFATDNSTLVLDGETVTNAGGTVQVDAADATHFSTLDLESATISGGNVNVAGLRNSTGTSFITDATITDTGRLEATGGTLTVDPSNVTNTGTIEATGGGTLVLSDTTVTNAGGTIEAFGTRASVQLSDATITGGTLETGANSNADGVIEVVAAGGLNTSVFDGSAGALTIDGYVKVDGGANLALRQHRNLGTIDVTSGANPANLQISGTVTLDGSGRMTLDGSTDGIVGAPGGGILINVDNTIFGDGSIGGGDASFILINEQGGVINASGTSALVIDNDSAEVGDTVPANAVVNTGTIEANGTLIDDREHHDQQCQP